MFLDELVSRRGYLVVYTDGHDSCNSGVTFCIPSHTEKITMVFLIRTRLNYMNGNLVIELCMVFISFTKPR